MSQEQILTTLMTAQTTLNHIRFACYHNFTYDRNLCQDLLAIENTDLDLKVHMLHNAN